MPNDPNDKDIARDEARQMAADMVDTAAAAPGDEPQIAANATAAADTSVAAEPAAADVAAAEAPVSPVDTPQTVAPEAARKAREMTGVVLSNKAEKTITVRVDRRVKHPVYGKFIRRSTKLAAHDPGNRCQEGDVVAIVETRPISRTKSWRLARIVERANG